MGTEGKQGWTELAARLCVSQQRNTGLRSGVFLQVAPTLAFLLPSHQLSLPRPQGAAWWFWAEWVKLALLACLCACGSFGSSGASLPAGYMTSWTLQV